MLYGKGFKWAVPPRPAGMTQVKTFHNVSNTRSDDDTG